MYTILKIFLDPSRLLLKSFAGLLVECQTGNANVKVVVTMQSIVIKPLCGHYCNQLVNLKGSGLALSSCKLSTSQNRTVHVHCVLIVTL